MPRFVRCSVQDQVATVLLDRPEVHNAFNEVVIGELHKAFEEIGGDAGVRAVVLAANGPSFCAGADVNWMKRTVGYSFEENVEDAMNMARMLQAIHDCPKPVIARVHGSAFGGGIGLVAACDMAVAVGAAVFCLSEVKLGVIPAVVSLFVAEKTGASACRRYALTAERFGAAEARRIGLVSDVVAGPEQLDPWIKQVTDSIKATGPEAVSTCKAVLRELLAFDWGRALDLAARRTAERRVCDEAQEGMSAFLDKRPPRWR